MKKFLTILSLIFAMFIFVSCGSDEEEIETVSGDDKPSGDTAPADDTAADTGDTTPAEQGDTDSTDTTPAETPDSETPSSDPGEPCVPNCEGKECGVDGCGGTCGDYNGGCQEGYRCTNKDNLNTCECIGTCDGTHCGTGTDNGCGEPCGCNGTDQCNTETNLCECVPHCEEGWECGNDGCGGTCGEGCGDGFCIESTHKCKTCTKITLAPVADLSNGGTGRYYKTVKNAYTPNTGDSSKEDKYVLSFTKQTIENGTTIDLSEFDSLKKCEEGMAKESICFIIGEDNARSDGALPNKTYFTQKGTLTIDEYNKSNDHIKFTLTGVKLGEMKHEDGGLGNGGDKDYFVEGGDCIVIEDTTLTYPAE